MRSDDERERLRQTFGAAAERYDRTRPSYPGVMLDRLAELGGLAPGDRVLEIGCGTGQLTRSLVARGYRVTAVELSEDLAAVARRNVPEAEVITGDFEQWPLPDEPFAAVAAATSFHWIDPAVQFTKTAAALRPGGALAIIGTAHVDGGSSEFFVEVQKCYERWDPEHTRPDLRLAKAESIKDDFDVTPGGFFERVGTAREVVEVPYDTESYLDLLQTFSGHLALPPERLDGLLGCIRDLIDDRYDGRVIKANLFRMVVGRKR
ncbi:class I SAM-dependent methyltransferase [Microlunatus parietis]|uniref:SAM-dependent methyltransferase n=1 Tax=Microlunatus parietis TaxID=682979 RepID=A0A7Y9I5X8_9ACTN|nr:class I SAM-dependent methyltransferase [Microlunatus parietis]NYE70630.1 SAM-dependent methyltransferase [Microlunatus parietis]